MPGIPCGHAHGYDAVLRTSAQCYVIDHGPVHGEAQVLGMRVGGADVVVQGVQTAHYVLHHRSAPEQRGIHPGHTGYLALCADVLERGFLQWPVDDGSACPGDVVLPDVHHAPGEAPVPHRWWCHQQFAVIITGHASITYCWQGKELCMW